MSAISKGSRVIVFDDPINCTRREGAAVVTKVLRVEPWADADGRQIVRCNVRFPRTDYNDGGVYERDVSVLEDA